MNDNTDPTGWSGPVRLAADSFATGEAEIHCDLAAVQIAQASDALLSDEEARQRFPALFQHFRFCPDCLVEYRMVMDFARRAAAAHFTRPSRMPPLPKQFRSGGESMASKIYRAIFPGFSFQAPSRALRGRQASSPVTVRFDDAQFEVQLQVSGGDADPDLRNLTGMVRPLPTATAVTASVATLLAGALAEDNVEQSAELVNAGEAIFMDILPGEYGLRLELAGQIYEIEQIVIP